MPAEGRAVGPLRAGGTAAAIADRGRGPHVAAVLQAALLVAGCAWPCASVPPDKGLTRASPAAPVSGAAPTPSDAWGADRPAWSDAAVAPFERYGLELVCRPRARVCE